MTAKQKMIVISQPRYLPSLNYFHRMMIADEFVFLDNVQYTARDWENRNKIKTPQGISWLTVPVAKARRGELIRNTHISKDDRKWARKHLRSLETSYSRAPFFNELSPFFQKYYGREWDRLMDLNRHFVDFVCDYLEIDCVFSNASDCNPQGTGQELLLDICHRKNAAAYLSGPLGSDYIQESLWQEQGVELYFHDYQYPAYSQLSGEFAPWLSIVDLLMNHGTEAKTILSKHQPSLSQ